MHTTCCNCRFSCHANSPAMHASPCHTHPPGTHASSPLPCAPPITHAPTRHTCHAWPPAMYTPPRGQNSWHTLVKTLPCRNFVAGGKNNRQRTSPKFYFVQTRLIMNTVITGKSVFLEPEQFILYPELNTIKMVSPGSHDAHLYTFQYGESMTSFLDVTYNPVTKTVYWIDETGYVWRMKIKNRYPTKILSYKNRNKNTRVFVLICLKRVSRMKLSSQTSGCKKNCC